MNIEANHATWAGHTFARELRMARGNDMFGSIDANKGDYQNGWDTAHSLNLTDLIPQFLPFAPFLQNQ